MAKKAVASFKKADGRTYSKVIKMVKSPKTGGLHSSRKRWSPTKPSRSSSLNRTNFVGCSALAIEVAPTAATRV